MKIKNKPEQQTKCSQYWEIFTLRVIICLSLIIIFLTFGLIFKVIQQGSVLNGAGGEPNPFGPYNKVMFPPDYATFSPVILTTTITSPVTGKITSHFGYRYHPITDQLDFHKGVDIAAPYGTPILAAISGTVIKAGVSDTAGNYLILDHGNGLLTTYMHCSVLLVTENAKIKEGEVIAKVGSTGLSTGNHLHFQMTLKNIVFDPSWVVNLSEV